MIRLGKKIRVSRARRFFVFFLSRSSLSFVTYLLVNVVSEFKYRRSNGSARIVDEGVSTAAVVALVAQSWALFE